MDIPHVLNHVFFYRPYVSAFLQMFQNLGRSFIILYRTIDNKVKLDLLRKVLLFVPINYKFYKVM